MRRGQAQGGGRSGWPHSVAGSGRCSGGWLLDHRADPTRSPADGSLRLGLNETLLSSAGEAAGAVRTADTEVTAAAQGLRAALNGDLQNVVQRRDVNNGARGAAMRDVTDALARLRRARHDGDEVARRTASCRRACGLGSNGGRRPRRVARGSTTRRRPGGRAPHCCRTCRSRGPTGQRGEGARCRFRCRPRLPIRADERQLCSVVARHPPRGACRVCRVQRRAGGATFVNLMASLRTEPSASRWSVTLSASSATRRRSPGPARRA